MNKRSKSIPLLALVAVIALVLGSFGTATAAGLTKAKVKKIATKVVKKQAPSLSVASAANATQLGGQPASAYQNASYRYRLPTQAAAAEKVYSFPGLPPGKYVFTYNVLAAGGAAGMFCYMRPTSANTNGESFQYASLGLVASISASGIIETTATTNLRCANSGNFTIYNGGDVTPSVTFTRIDALTAGTTTAPGAVGGTAATTPLTR